MVFGVSKFSGFRGGVVMTFVLLEHMACHRQALVLGFSGFWGFEVFGVSGWGRDDIRFA